VLRIPEPPFTYYKVTGADRVEWLQGQLTQNVVNVQPGEWRRTAILNATGQLLADGAFWVFDDHILLGLDRLATSVPETLAARIIMEDVNFEPLTDSVQSVVGEVVTNGTALPVDHVGALGYDLIGVDLIHAEDIDYETARIEAASPLAGIDYDGRTLAMEMGPHFIATRIAFDKGCYTGQEIVERIRSRGHTNRQWVGLRSGQPIPDSPDAKITSRASSPRFGHIALAFVRNDLARTGTLIGDASVVPLPFK
jgi:folate-binding protein YgfZ